MASDSPKGWLVELIFWTIIIGVLCVLVLFCGCNEPPRKPCCPNRRCDVNVHWRGGAVHVHGERNCDNCGPRAASTAEGPVVPTPMAKLEKDIQQGNWGGGSCTYASFCNSARNANMPALANWVRTNHKGSCGRSQILALCESRGVAYRFTDRGEAGLLDWASRNRRIAVVFYYDNHCVNFCGWDAQGRAVLIDNNWLGYEDRIERGRFLQLWDLYGKSYGLPGGFALALDYPPLPPNPREAIKIPCMARHTRESGIFALK